MEKIVNNNIKLLDKYKERRKDPKDNINLVTFLTKAEDEDITESYIDYLRDINRCFGYLAPGSAPDCSTRQIPR